MISYLAAFVTLVSVGAIAFYVTMFFVGPKPPSGFVTLLVAVLFLGGVQLTCLSNCW